MTDEQMEEVRTLGLRLHRYLRSIDSEVVLECLAAYVVAYIQAHSVNETFLDEINRFVQDVETKAYMVMIPPRKH